MIETITSKKYKIKQIFEGRWEEYRNIHSDIPKYILANVSKMLNCRDPKKLGYHKYCCPTHPNKCTVVPHTCKSRICSSCGVNSTNHYNTSLYWKIYKKTRNSSNQNN
ncbi:transposase zinc-binding domain-containing protein [Patescibacteria group bacterium]|nr:transposase zinc-binding domain-containing protein [Patescibacteria group bacterium]